MVYGGGKMIIKYEGHKFIYDSELDFLMLYKCYINGCNCWNCTERVFDGCVIDELDEKITKNWGKNEGF